MKQFTIFFLIGCCLFIGMFLYANGYFYKKYHTQVKSVIGSYLQLKSGEVVRLAGIGIPLQENIHSVPDLNYQELLQKNIEQLLLNQNIVVKPILKKISRLDGSRSFEYPDVNVVEVFLNRVSINEKLLSEGMAFYNFDYLPKRKKYQKLESNARKKK